MRHRNGHGSNSPPLPPFLCVSKVLCFSAPHFPRFWHLDNPWQYTYLVVPNPKSVKVNVTTGTGMDIEWDDGHHTHYTFQWLRDACPCATCTEDRNNHARQPGEPPKPLNALLPMYKEPVRPKEVKAVGKYALNIAWNDGHASGIYSWDDLREMCQCEECRARVAAS